MSLSEIARETGLDRKTVRKYLSAPGPATPLRRSTNGRSLARKIDEFAPLIDSMLRAEVLMKASVIHERLAWLAQVRMVWADGSNSFASSSGDRPARTSSTIWRRNLGG
ncbi:hypothetical protein [Streptomyces brasiliensis]|uniref:hypothetical protein n=1 Tax=Streptomyces brasiliensis TaxID=1954 RepID=UPI0040330C29